MTFDPIANTITDPTPPCPFCGGKVHGNAISIPPFLVGCSTCGAAIPAEHYRAVCAAMAGKTQKYLDYAVEVRWQMRQVLEFYHTPPKATLEPLGARWAVLVEAWRLTEERL